MRRTLCKAKFRPSVYVVILRIWVRSREKERTLELKKNCVELLYFRRKNKPSKPWETTTSKYSLPLLIFKTALLGSILLALLVGIHVPIIVFLTSKGFHRFYTGDTGMGVLQCLTCGGCWIWSSKKYTTTNLFSHRLDQHGQIHRRKKRRYLNGPACAFHSRRKLTNKERKS